MTKFIDFYFDFSSPYAYIGYKEIKKLEKKEHKDHLSPNIN